MHIFFNFSSSTSTLFPISIHLSLFLVFYSYLSFNTVRYLACLAKPFIRHVGCLVFSAELEVSPSISISPAFPWFWSLFLWVSSVFVVPSHCGFYSSPFLSSSPVSSSLSCLLSSPLPVRDAGLPGYLFSPLQE